MRTNEEQDQDQKKKETELEAARKEHQRRTASLDKKNQ